MSSRCTTPAVLRCRPTRQALSTQTRRRASHRAALTPCTTSLHHRRGIYYITSSSSSFPLPKLYTPQATSLQSKTFNRGAKTKTTMSVSSLPQGPLKDNAPLAPVEPAEPGYSKLYAQLYFEQAETIGPLLNLKVARKRTTAGNIAMAGFPIFQLDRMLKTLVQELNYHVAISEEFHNSEKLNPSSPAFGLMFDRRVARIITRGTLIDEKFMDPYENNFLLSVAMGEQQQEGEKEEVEVGLAWLDLSTGDFFTQESSLSVIASDLARIGPREVVTGADMKDAISSLPEMQLSRHLITFLSEDEDVSSAESAAGWEKYFSTDSDGTTTTTRTKTSASDVGEFSDAEVKAGSRLLNYVAEKLQGLPMKLQAPVRRTADENVFIDANTMRTLEVKQTLQEGVTGGRGSLIREVRRTVTKSGARRLTAWLTSPETNIQIINDRLDIVEFFLNNGEVRGKVQAFLQASYDSLRLLQRLTLGRGDADDLLDLAKTIDASGAILALLKKQKRKKNGESKEILKSLSALLDRLDIPTDLSELITKSIDEDGLMMQQRIDESAAAEAAEEGADAVEAAEEGDSSTETTATTTASRIKARVRKAKGSGRLVKPEDREKFEAWIMMRDASPMLRVLHEQLEKHMVDKALIESDIREETELSNLTLRWTPMLGHIVHVKSKAPIGYERGRMRESKLVSSSKSTQSYHLPEWTYLGSQIEVTRMQIRGEEQRVLSEIRNKVLSKIVTLRRNAAVLDEIDVACSFAVLATEQKFVRPILNNGTSHRIIGGRHPVVEEGLQQQGRTFTSNDCLVGDSNERVWLITGPNMAGKSTFLRQNALITILAQVGSFVPCEYAEIGIVDKIFSRVGSADNLYRDQSTFKVEMNETTTILRHATSRSFVIMDEVGRGTTPSDGIAIAYGALWHLHEINRSRVLFATHFHVLAELSQRDGLDSVGCYCTDVRELPATSLLTEGGRQKEIDGEKITIGDKGEGAFAYVHRLRKGINRRSHAIKVARLAGLPEEAIKVAERVLNGGAKGWYEGIDVFLPMISGDTSSIRSEEFGGRGGGGGIAPDSLAGFRAQLARIVKDGKMEREVDENVRKAREEAQEAWEAKTAVVMDGRDGAIEAILDSQSDVQVGASLEDSNEEKKNENEDELDLYNLRYMYPNSFQKYHSEEGFARKA